MEGGKDQTCPADAPDHGAFCSPLAEDVCSRAGLSLARATAILTFLAGSPARLSIPAVSVSFLLLQVERGLLWVR